MHNSIAMTNVNSCNYLFKVSFKVVYAEMLVESSLSMNKTEEIAIAKFKYKVNFIQLRNDL